MHDRHDGYRVIARGVGGLSNPFLRDQVLSSLVPRAEWAGQDRVIEAQLELAPLYEVDLSLIDKGKGMELENKHQGGNHLSGCGNLRARAMESVLSAESFKSVSTAASIISRYMGTGTLKPSIRMEYEWSISNSAPRPASLAVAGYTRKHEDKWYQKVRRSPAAVGSAIVYDSGEPAVDYLASLGRTKGLHNFTSTFEHQLYLSLRRACGLYNYRIGERHLYRDNSTKYSNL